MLLEKVEANQEVHDNFQKGGKEDSFSFEICGQGFKQEKCNSFDGCPNEKRQLMLTGPKKN